MTVKHHYDCGALDQVAIVAQNMSMENIKAIRIRRNLTQATLAEMAGVDQAFISRIEKGRGNPTLDVIRAIAGALRVEPHELFSLPDLQQRAIAALGEIPGQAAKEAALVVLETMARGKQ